MGKGVAEDMFPDDTFVAFGVLVGVLVGVVVGFVPAASCDTVVAVAVAVLKD